MFCWSSSRSLYYHHLLLISKSSAFCLLPSAFCLLPSDFCLSPTPFPARGRKLVLIDVEKTSDPVLPVDCVFEGETEFPKSYYDTDKEQDCGLYFVLKNVNLAGKTGSMLTQALSQKPCLSIMIARTRHCLNPDTAHLSLFEWISLLIPVVQSQKLITVKVTGK